MGCYEFHTIHSTWAYRSQLRLTHADLKRRREEEADGYRKAWTGFTSRTGEKIPAPKD
jgi:hypothetical protein